MSEVHTSRQSKEIGKGLGPLMQADPLLILAECKWIGLKERKRKYFVAGFEIIHLSEGDRKTLRDFIEFLLLSKSGEWQRIGWEDERHMGHCGEQISGLNLVLYAFCTCIERSTTDYPKFEGSIFPLT
jgi:hypothetical protein